MRFAHSTQKFTDYINAKTAATRWDGGPLGYGIAVDSLMSLRRDVQLKRRYLLQPQTDI